MKREDPPLDWRRLLRLVAPVHDEARGAARRLAATTCDGDDLFQDTLLRALRKLPTLRDESRFRPWFYAVLLSVHRSRTRRAFWRRFLSLDGERERGWDPIGEDGGGFAEETTSARRVSRALATLPAVQREAVVLFELEDFSVEEIADMQDASVSAVKSRLARGRERLRRHYEALGFREEANGPVRRKRRRVSASSDDSGASLSSAWTSAAALSFEEKNHE